MKIEDIGKQAFAMPLTSPAFPSGPYRFVDREYLVITYETDPAALRAVIPEPLVGTLDYGPVRIVTATMGFKHHAVDHKVVVAARAKQGALHEIRQNHLRCRGPVRPHHARDEPLSPTAS